MKHIIVLFLSLLPLTILCQEKKVPLGFEGSFGASYSHINKSTSLTVTTNNSITSIPLEDEVLSLNNSAIVQKSRFAYDFGVILSRELSDKFNFQTGVKLVAVGNSTMRESSFIEYFYRSFFLEIPLRLNYTIPVKTKSWKVSFGQSPSFNFANRQKTIERRIVNEEVVTRDKMSINNLRRLNLNTQFGFVWEKTMKNGNVLSIFPNVRIQNFGRTKKGELDDQRFIFYAITTGIRI